MTLDKRNKKALIAGLCNNISIVNTLGELLKHQPNILSDQNELPKYFLRQPKRVKKKIIVNQPSPGSRTVPSLNNVVQGETPV